MKVKIQSSGQTINLTQSNFVAAGGEGSVYIVNGIAYKIYNNESKMLPIGKIEDLSRISNQRVVRPIDVLMSGSTPVGYSMQAVQNALPLQATLTKAYREREALSIDKILRRVQSMRDTIADIHAANILVVDMNELNELVIPGKNDVYFIDCDSWQTKRFHATAITESIRDRHCLDNAFDENTDWFAFAILSHQMMRAVHPYKGRVDGYKPSDLDARMRNNISVYNPKVRLNRAVYPESMVPNNYLEWFKAVFEKGIRTAPPNNFSDIVTVARTTRMVHTNDGFITTMVLTGEGNVVTYTSIGQNQDYAVTENGLINIKNGISRRIDKPTKAIFLDDDGNTMCFDGLTATNIKTQAKVTADVIPEQFMTYRGRLYVKTTGVISEITVKNNGKKLRFRATTVAQVMPSATKLYPGCSVTQVMGSWIFNTMRKTGESIQHNITRLRDYEVIDAEYSQGILVVCATNRSSGISKKFIFKEDGDKLRLFLEKDDPSDMSPNFVVLDNGVVIVAEDEGVEIFSSSFNANKVQFIRNDTINNGVRLTTHHGMAAYISDDTVVAFKKK